MLAGNHLRQERLRHKDRPSQVDPVAGVPVLDRPVLNRSHRGDSGIVENNVHSPEKRPGLGLQACDALLAPHVGLDESRRAGAEFILDCLSGPSPGGWIQFSYHNLGSKPNQRSGGLESDPSPSTRDNGHQTSKSIRS